MITPRDLKRWASDVLATPTVSEVGIRRSVSALYYGLFQRLASEGAGVFAGRRTSLRRQLTRAFDHGSMREFCTSYRSWSSNPKKVPNGAFAGQAPNADVAIVADVFVQLQEARHAADYDLSAPFDRAIAIQLLLLAEAADWKLDELKGSAELRAFLICLLLSRQLARRG